VRAVFKHLEWVPILGALIFFGGHFVAAQFYNGGHQWDYDAQGYNLLRNFWCDLIWPTDYNGNPNPASGIGIFTTVFLTVSLAVFFIEFARAVPMSNISKRLIMFCGVISMGFTSLIFTEAHTFAIYIAAGFAFVALIPMITSLFKNRYLLLMAWGGLTIGALLLSIYILATRWAYHILPFEQKIAFTIGLTWLIAVCWKIRALKRLST